MNLPRGWKGLFPLRLTFGIHDHRVGCLLGRIRPSNEELDQIHTVQVHCVKRFRGNLMTRQMVTC